VFFVVYTADQHCCAAAGNEEQCAVNSSDECSQASNSDAKSPVAVQPPIKKSRLLGDVDISSPDIQKLLHAKSAHVSLVNEVLYCPHTACVIFLSDVTL